MPLTVYRFASNAVRPHIANQSQDMRSVVTNAMLPASNCSKAAIEKDALVPVRPCDQRYAFGRLLVNRRCWTLSWFGKLLVLFTVAALALSLFFSLYRLLAITDRVDTNVLVVEGWVHHYGVRAAAEEFTRSRYQRIFTTGGPVVGNGGYVNDQQTSASVGAGGLREAGVPPAFVQMVPSKVIGRDRTYSSAVALRNWLNEHNTDVHSFNVLTQDCHARRTRLLFQKAFGPSVRVGVISVPSPDYDPKQWWRYSEGVQSALSEGIGYLYARVFFWPQAAKPQGKGDGRW